VRGEGAVRTETDEVQLKRFLGDSDVKTVSLEILEEGFSANEQPRFTTLEEKV